MHFNFPIFNHFLSGVYMSEGYLAWGLLFRVGGGVFVLEPKIYIPMYYKYDSKSLYCSFIY